MKAAGPFNRQAGHDAERVGFEPTVPGYGTHAFQACPFDRSGTSPWWNPRPAGATRPDAVIPGLLHLHDLCLFVIECSINL